MRRHFLASTLIVTVIGAATLAPDGGFAQGGQLPQPPQGFQEPPAPPPAPVKPYKPVAETPPAAYSDPSFAAFRKNLAEIAQGKDRAALAKDVVARGFFWVQDKNNADKTKSGIDNLAKAIGLDNPDGSGWDIIAAAADDPTLAELPQSNGAFCAPAPPQFDPQALQALIQQTDTDPTDWGYASTAGADVRAAAQDNAQTVEKLGLYFVRVLADGPAASPGQPQFLHLALPDGKTGFVAADAVNPLASDQICYRKAAGGWQIAGYIGGVQP
ncbi:MAG: hypothetical protein WBF58_00705 [Xanthobacteraceae bacterium]